MKKLRFAVIGSGWRSLFYWRAAQAYPELFEMTAMLCRTEEKAERMRREYGVPAVVSEEACQEGKPDFVVAAVSKASICQVTCHWVSQGFPVLCETPAAMNLEELRRLWQLSEKDARIQVAEQYFLYPSFAAGIAAVEKGYLGEPYAMDISAAHDYHAASLIRRYLGTGLDGVTVFGERYRFPVEETDSRYGAVTDGTVTERERVRLTFDFDCGKTAFYDFSGIQYHSFIRGRYLRVQGRRGELDGEILRYVDAAHVPHEERFSVLRDGGIVRILLGTEVLYENPLVRLGQPALPSQDETAVASLLLGMKDYLARGTEVYPLAEALEDAYLRILMEQALTGGEKVHSEPQIWQTKNG